MHDKKNYNPSTSGNQAEELLEEKQSSWRAFLPENKLLLDVPKPQNVDKRVLFKFDYSTTGWERHEAKKLWKVQVHAGKLQQKVSYCSLDMTRSSTSSPVDAARVAVICTQCRCYIITGVTKKHYYNFCTRLWNPLQYSFGIKIKLKLKVFIDIFVTLSDYQVQDATIQQLQQTEHRNAHSDSGTHTEIHTHIRSSENNIMYLMMTETSLSATRRWLPWQQLHWFDCLSATSWPCRLHTQHPPSPGPTGSSERSHLSPLRQALQRADRMREITSIVNPQHKRNFTQYGFYPIFFPVPCCWLKTNV